ncbi:MAG TPA: isoprenylcysteine carboxylmethyltransferase family protein [Aliidongia sp.]|nr:isoprenylcysteine carboxylmethyltransferase family protein [Aliidongia sp.]
MKAILAHDGLVNAALALWFFALALMLSHDIMGTRTAPDSLLDAARLLSKSCVFLFYAMLAWATLIRVRPVARAAGWQPRATALLGSYLSFALPFLPTRADLGVTAHLVSAGCVLLGIGLALFILMRLRHSFSIMAEARRLVTSGPYAIIRHPLYAAEALALIGIFIQYASVPAALIVAVQLCFQVQRMRNEEAVLQRTFPEYKAYAARTARLVPGVW